MNVRHTHVPIDRLTALAFTARAAFDGDQDALESEHDHQALRHVAECERCASELTRLTSEADQLRDAAFAEADAVFDEAMLDAQRTRILDRLAHLGQVARVLRFPARTRHVAMPVSAGNRRWVSVAAAAGLIIGLLAGQMLHFVPAWEIGSHRDTAASMQATPRTTAPPRTPVSVAQSLSDDELLAEIDKAVVIRSAAFRTLDALTPLGSASDFRDPMGH